MNNDYNNNNNGFGNEPPAGNNGNWGQAQNTQQGGTYYAEEPGNRYSFGNQPPMYDNNPYQQPAVEDKEGSSAQVLGIVGIVVTFVCCQLIGLILGIVAMNKAKASRTLLGYESQEAKVGRICGLIAVIAGAISMAITVVVFILYIGVIMAMITGGEFALLPLAFL